MTAKKLIDRQSLRLEANPLILHTKESKVTALFLCIKGRIIFFFLTHSLSSLPLFFLPSPSYIQRKEDVRTAGRPGHVVLGPRPAAPRGEGMPLCLFVRVMLLLLLLRDLRVLLGLPLLLLQLNHVRRQVCSMKLVSVYQ